VIGCSCYHRESTVPVPVLLLLLDKRMIAREPRVGSSAKLRAKAEVVEVKVDGWGRSRRSVESTREEGRSWNGSGGAGDAGSAGCVDRFGVVSALINSPTASTLEGDRSCTALHTAQNSDQEL
jgi:hypothetical protein